MKNLFLFLLLCSCAFPVFTQQDSLIYGLARNSSPPALYMSTIDPQTGTVSNLSSTSAGIGLSLSGTAIDADAGIFYYTIIDTFIGVDMVTGAVVSKPTLTMTNGAFFDGFIFNCADSLIYGLARNGSPASLYLSSINPVTGVVTHISPQSIGTSITLLSYTLDPVNRVYYFISDGKLIGLDLDTGVIVSNPTITNVNGTYLDGMVYHEADSTLYGLARSSSPAAIYFASVNPATGVVSNISPTSISTTITLSSATIDPETNQYHFISDGKFRSVDMVTGTLTASPTINNVNGTYFDGFLYYKGGCQQAVPTYTYTTDSLTLCAGDSALLGGAYQTQSGTYLDTIFATNTILTTELTVLAPNSNSIVGLVSYQGQGITAGSVGLVQVDPSNPSMMNIIDTVAVDANGLYRFENLAKGTYYVIAIGDPGLYLSIPTYSYSADVWQLADSAVFNTNCPDTAEMDVALLEILQAAIGTGTLTGQIGQRISQGGTSPAADIAITLRQASDNAVIQLRYSDASGMFQFEDIPFGEYRIHVDQPGFEMDSSHQFVFNDTTDAYSAEVCINDSSQLIEVCDLRITTGLTQAFEPGAGLSLFPNPFQDRFTMVFDQQQTFVRYDIQDAMGRIVKSSQESQSQEIVINMEAFPAGLYFLRVEYQGRLVSARMLKK